MEDTWYEDHGAVIMLMVGSLVARRYRGLSTHKVEALVDSIMALGYDRTTVITVQVVAGVYFVVDGLHRVTAALECIGRGVLVPGFKVAAKVLKEATPESFVVMYFAKVNNNNGIVWKPGRHAPMQALEQPLDPAQGHNYLSVYICI